MSTKFVQRVWWSFVLAILVSAWFALPAARAIVVACNESDLYSQVAGCTSTSDPCVINDIVICGSSCGGTCTYNLGTKQLKLTGTDGSFVNATGSPANLSFTTGSILTTSEAVLRFDTGGTGKTLTLSASGSGGIWVYPGNIFSSGATAGNVVASAPTGTITLGGVDVHATGSTAVGGNVTLTAEDGEQLEDDIDASGPAGGGTIVVRGGSAILIVGDMLAKATSTGTAGTVNLYMTDTSVFNPSITTTGKITATGSSNADGGTVFMGLAPENTTGPRGRAQIGAAVDVSGGNGDAGTITIEVTEVVSTGTMALKASAASTSGTHGGTITVKSYAGASNFKTIEAKGEAGGKVDIASDYDMTFEKDISVISNQTPAGTGGIVSLRGLTRNGTTNCWDCQLPGDPCNCVTPISCTQLIQINEDILATGTGTSGVGGIITLEAPYVYMKQSGTTAKRLLANANSATDATGGAAPGRIRVRARDSQFRARTSGGTNHKVRGLPNADGVIEIGITQPLGGDYNPNFTLIGPTYAPQCNPG